MSFTLIQTGLLQHETRINIGYAKRVTQTHLSSQ